MKFIELTDDAFAVSIGSITRVSVIDNDVLFNTSNGTYRKKFNTKEQAIEYYNEFLTEVGVVEL